MLFAGFGDRDMSGHQVLPEWTHSVSSVDRYCRPRVQTQRSTPCWFRKTTRELAGLTPRWSSGRGRAILSEGSSRHLRSLRFRPVLFHSGNPCPLSKETHTQEWHPDQTQTTITTRPTTPPWLPPTIGGPCTPAYRRWNSL